MANETLYAHTDIIYGFDDNGKPKMVKAGDAIGNKITGDDLQVLVDSDVAKPEKWTDPGETTGVSIMADGTEPH